MGKNKKKKSKNQNKYKTTSGNTESKSSRRRKNRENLVKNILIIAKSRSAKFREIRKAIRRPRTENKRLVSYNL